MISQSVILEEIDNGCYGCYAKGTDENKVKNNENVKNLLVEKINTLDDLGSLNNINEYEVDKAFLDKMKYIKEHKNETDNLIYTGGLDFFRRLKQVLEVKVAGDSDDSKELSEAKELYELCNGEFNDKLSVFTEKLTEYNKGIGETFKKQTEEFTVTTNGIYELKKKLSEIKAELAGDESKINLDFIIKFNELKNSLDEVIKAISDVEESKKQLDEAMADKFKVERDKFMEQYEVSEDQDNTDELPASVAERLCSDDVYVKKAAKAIVVLGANNRCRAFSANDEYNEVRERQDEKTYTTMFKLMTRKRFSEKYNIFFI